MSADRTRTVAARTVGSDERIDDSRGGWIPDADRRTEAFEPVVSDLLAPAIERIDGGDRVAVVPDVHYPFHPSSGMVTDPAVVGAVVSTLEREAGSEILLAGGSEEAIELERTTEYLGYPPILSDSDHDLVDLDSERTSRVGVSLPEEPTATVSVPDPLLENPVIVVPTLRPTEAGPIAGSMRLLGRHVGSDGTDRELSAGARSAAAADAVDPALSLLDAATAFAGEPHATNTLFAGDPIAVDAVGARLLERSVENDDALSSALADDRTTVSVEGCDLDALSERLPSGELPPRTETSPLVSMAYGLYAKVSGDAVPPQLEVER